jgi:proline iminopeptidase
VQRILFTELRGKIMLNRLTVKQEAYKISEVVENYLYPEIRPYNEGFLQVSELHSLYFAQYGNPKGRPVLALHGGPGGGIGSRDMRFFDPNFYRIIVYDQRGAGRSLPHAEIRENSTNDLILDIEKLRMHLNLDRLLLFGGSWGSALALAYAESHPQQVLGIILRGVFLGREKEYMQLWHGMGDIYPEAFDEYQNFIPKEEQDNLATAYYKRLMNADPRVHLPAAEAFCRYDFICATLFDKNLVAIQLSDKRRVLALARLFAHYSYNKFFFKEGQLLDSINLISHVPGIIIHGRYDVICRVKSAYELYKAWPASTLHIVQDAGHSSLEPSMLKALTAATEEMKTKLS